MNNRRNKVCSIHSFNFFFFFELPLDNMCDILV